MTSRQHRCCIKHKTLKKAVIRITQFSEHLKHCTSHLLPFASHNAFIPSLNSNLDLFLCLEFLISPINEGKQRICEV